MNIIKEFLNSIEVNNSYRIRAEVYIIKNNNLIVGIPHKKNNWYIIPGGKVEDNESNEEAAKREALEEVGVKVKNLKYISNKKTLFKDPIYYIGSHDYSYVGMFDGYDKSLWGKHKDSYDIKELDIDEAIKIFKGYNIKQEDDVFFYERSAYIVGVLKKIKKCLNFKFFLF